MNSRFSDTPEVIATITVTKNGDDDMLGDFVCGVSVKNFNGSAVATIDIREFRKAGNLACEIELSELVAALSLATLNSSKD